MSVIFWVVGVLFFLAAIAVLATSKSAFHETNALLAFVASGVFMAGGAIVGAVNRGFAQIAWREEVRNRRSSDNIPTLQKETLDEGSQNERLEAAPIQTTDIYKIMGPILFVGVVILAVLMLNAPSK